MKKEDPKKETKIVDASGLVPGRLASQIAVWLMGKDRPTYTPHLDELGRQVEVINASQMNFRPSKMSGKVYRHHTGHIGGLKTKKMAEIVSQDPTEILRLAVSRMLPRNRLRRGRLKRLIIHR